jgi:BlaI family penicillinase repressor
MSPERKPARPLTRLELEIMQELWDHGAMTVQQVQGRLENEPKLAYTTVQTMLNVLQRKGWAGRKLEGKAYRYHAKVGREKAESQSLTDLIDRLFRGSVESMAMNLVQHKELDREKLKKLRQAIELRLREEGRDAND